MMFFSKQLKIAVLITMPFLFTACAGMNSKFDCNVKSGGMCAPLNRIDEMASRGAFHERRVGAPGQGNSNYVTKNVFAPYPLSTYEGRPMRYGETIQRIWIAPYIDTSGNYHEPSYVYTVIKKGHWIGDPVQAIAEDD